MAVRRRWPKGKLSLSFRIRQSLIPPVKISDIKKILKTIDSCRCEEHLQTCRDWCFRILRGSRNQHIYIKLSQHITERKIQWTKETTSNR